MAEHSMVVAVVEDLDDPEKLGRVRVKLPHLDDKLSNWARVVSAGAGKCRGAFFRPERGDEVVVGFEKDDPRRPYVLGGVWSVPDPPPPDQNATDNNLRQIVTRSGHVLRFDDTDRAERIELIAAGGKQQVVLDPANGRIEVTATDGDVIVDAAGDVTVKSGGDLRVTATGDIRIEASGRLTLRGSSVDIN